MEEVMEWMSANGVAPDVVTLNTLLAGLETQGKDEAAWNLLTKFGIQYSFHKPRRTTDAQSKPLESKASESKKHDLNSQSKSHEPTPNTTIQDAPTVPQHLVAVSAAPTKAAEFVEGWSVRPDLFTVRTVLPVCRRGRVVERALALYSLALESAGSASGSGSSSSSGSSRNEGSSGIVARGGERSGSTRQQQQHGEVAAALRFACNEEMKQIIATLERQVDGNRQADGNWQADVHVQSGKAEQIRSSKAAALAQDIAQGDARRDGTATNGIAAGTVAGAASGVGEREGGEGRSEVAATGAAATAIGAAAVGAKAAAAVTSRGEFAAGMDEREEEEEQEEQEEQEGEEAEEEEEQEREQGQRAGSRGAGESMMRHGTAGASRVLWLLDQMERVGIKADAETYRLALHACCLDDLVGHAKPVGMGSSKGTGMGHRKHGHGHRQGTCRQREIRTLFAAMRSHGFVPGLDTCHQVIGALGRAKKWWAALEVFESMKAQGPAPTPATERLIRGHFNILLTAARKRGLWKWSVSLLSKMESAGLPPDAYAWRTALVTCAKANETASAIKVFEDMVETGVRADAVAYGALLSALEKGDLLEPAEAVWGHMRKMGVEPNRQAYTTMIMEVSSATPPNATTYQQAAIALADASHWEAALSLIPRARSRGIEPTPLMFEVVQRSCAANGADFASQLAVVSTTRADLVGGAKS
ncbi:unnamed protein product [Closterium sp. Naga37s-1]|nr:unnamed protein product [Closterium sp. Naga37s-1]